MSWDVVLFDLDGTLTDSGLGVGNGVLYALAQMGFPKPSDDELKKYLGLESFVPVDVGLKNFADWAHKSKFTYN